MQNIAVLHVLCFMFYCSCNRGSKEAIRGQLSESLFAISDFVYVRPIIQSIRSWRLAICQLKPKRRRGKTATWQGKMLGKMCLRVFLKKVDRNAVLKSCVKLRGGEFQTPGFAEKVTPFVTTSI